MIQKDLITKPIEAELLTLRKLIQESLTSNNPILGDALTHIRKRSGKMMRPILTLLMAKCFGQVSESTFHAATSLELLHTASLVHDDVVDDSIERRGQPSVNALFNNQVSVLVGDYLLSTALYHASQTDDVRVIRLISQLGQCLAEGELLQLSNISNEAISEEVYFSIIRKKTGVLFETCAQVGALSVGATEEQIEWARKIGEIIGYAFQMKDDIFDYFDNPIIGKPTGNDMREGKLTLPIIHVLLKTQDEAMNTLAQRVKKGEATDEEIAVLIDFAKREGGIDYARQVMAQQVERARTLLAQCADEAVLTALISYIEYVVEREK
ncbi:MAG: polyprenyl synthetase family protein [Bacteroidaceae bacterium]|nr:polyprenyl synthetase family protein [Bacteroidaceae bacterium]